MNAYYNEHDRFAAAWLRELIRDGLIPAGDVDERDIQLVQPADLAGYEQCHFFAGIGGWAYALQLAGWSGSIWTGSCPCQPFSAAGQQGGFEDSRHLWPSWFRLIRECRPPVVFGEQVASADGFAWFDTVSTDLEAEAYAVGAADLAAASVGAPHLRQRLFFVADAAIEGLSRGDGPRAAAARPCNAESQRRGAYCLGDTLEPGLEGHAGDGSDGHQPGREHAGTTRPASPASCSRIVAPALGERLEGRRNTEPRKQAPRVGLLPAGPSQWADLEWLSCTDGKARPTQPGLFPLAHGIPNRVGTLRGAGNAICPQVAAQFIRAYLEGVTP